MTLNSRFMLYVLLLKQYDAYNCSRNIRYPMYQISKRIILDDICMLYAHSFKVVACDYG